MRLRVHYPKAGGWKVLFRVDSLKMIRGKLQGGGPSGQVGLG